MQLYRSELSTQFVDLFTKTIGLTEEHFEIIISHFNREYIPRKFFYLRAGEICKYIAYINKGSTRTFTMDDKGGEHILFFAFEDWLIGDLESLYTQQPGKLYIQAMEDCELLRISKVDMESLEEKMPKLKAWHLEKKTKSHFATLNRLTEVKTLTPEERYLNLIQKYPQIFQRIPLQYIASFLDIEPPSLSRLRKRLSCK
jgi:CRP-like cAMP-binding protein